MRVALVDLYLDRFRGGMPMALSHLVDGLSEHCDVTVFCSQSEGIYPATVRIIRLPAIHISRFLIEFFTFRLSWSFYRRWKNIDSQFDVVQCQSPAFGGGQVAIVNFCDAEFLQQLKKQWRTFAGTAIRGWLVLGYRMVLHSAASVIERRAYSARPPRGPKVLLPVSQGLREALIRHFNPQAPMEVIPNGVDLSMFLPRPDPELRQEVLTAGNWPETSFIVLFVGAGGWDRKGLDLVIESLPDLPNEVKLVVVGDGDRDRFEKLTDRCGVAQRVHFTGRRRDVARFYRIANTFAFPSRYEAQPLVCLEAMASGLPVVATRFHGIEDYLRDGVNGLLVDSKATAIANAIRWLLENPEGRLRVGKCAEESVQRFDKNEITRRVLDVLQRVSSGDKNETNADRTSH
jgi:glycosyltransferase involved in cell wall biosynthesis